MGVLVQAFGTETRLGSPRQSGSPMIARTGAVVLRATASRSQRTTAA